MKMKPSAFVENLCGLNIFFSPGVTLLLLFVDVVVLGDKTVQPRWRGQEGWRVHQTKSDRSGVYECRGCMDGCHWNNQGYVALKMSCCSNVPHEQI